VTAGSSVWTGVPGRYDRSGVNRFGTTERERRTGEPLAERLAEEDQTFSTGNDELSQGLDLLPATAAIA